MRVKRGWIGLLLLGSLAATSCGGSSGSSDVAVTDFRLPTPNSPRPTTPTPTPTSSVTPTPTPTPSGPSQASAPEPETRTFPERAWGENRFLVFSTARKLVAEDNNGHADIYLRDLLKGDLQMITRGSNGPSSFASVSSDGSSVVFLSEATNLARTDGNGKRDVYLYQAHKKAFLNLTSDGTADFSEPTISGDGKTVAAVSVDPGLVTGDTDGKADVFLFRIEPQSVSLISGSTTNATVSPSLDAAGRGVAYVTKRDGYWQVVAHDSQTGLEAVASQTLTAQLGNGDSFYPSLGGTSQKLAFSSKATNLGDNDEEPTVFWTAPGQLTAVAAGKSPVLSRDGLVFAYLRGGQAIHRDSSGTEIQVGAAAGASLSKNAVVWPDDEDLTARAVGRGSDVPMNPTYKAIEPIEHSVVPIEIAEWSREQSRFVDLNGDGKKDIFRRDRIALNSFSRAFVGLAQSDGSFQSSVQSLGGLVGAYQLADLDQDGDLDVIFLSQRCEYSPTPPPFGSTNTITTLRTAFNDGHGQFTPGAVRDLPHSGQLFVGHLNSDLILDVMIVLQAAPPTQAAAILILGEIGGVYSGTVQSVQIPANFTGTSLLSDVMGDGIEDLVLLDSATESLITLPNTGAGSFLSPVSTPFGGSPISSSIKSTDFNTDGRQDLLISESTSSTLSLWLSNGSGGFTKSREHSAPGGEIFIEDVDADGTLDWVVNHPMRSLYVFPAGESPAVVSPGIQGHLGFQTKPGEQSDLLALSSSNLIRLNGENGKYGIPLSHLPDVTTEWAVGDLDGDLRPDLLACQYQGAVIRRGDPDRNFTAEEAAVFLDLPPGFDGFSGVLDDFDSDGELDLLLTTSMGRVLLMFGSGDGRFASPFEFTVPVSGYGIRLRVSDLNSDGLPDVIANNYNDQELRYWLNQGARTFSESQLLPIAQPKAFEVGDLDGDGKKDLVVAKADASVVLYSWTDIGGFTAPSTLISAPSPLSFEDLAFDFQLQDLDLDGRDDLLRRGVLGNYAFFTNGCESFPVVTPALPPSLQPPLARRSTGGGLFETLTHTVLGYRSAQVRANLIADYDGATLRSRVLLEADSIWSVFTQQPGSVLQETKRLFVGTYQASGVFQKDVDFDGDFDIFIPRANGFSFLNR